MKHHPRCPCDEDECKDENCHRCICDRLRAAEQDAYADAERVCREKSPCRADSCQGVVDCPCAAYDECAEAIAARAKERK